jgi:predicted nuclease with TOPRIM domain
MKEQLEKRLAELKSEFEAGQKMMAELESKQSNLRDTLLRISGAIQILEEEINRVNDTSEPVQETPVEIIN